MQAGKQIQGTAREIVKQLKRHGDLAKIGNRIPRSTQTVRSWINGQPCSEETEKMILDAMLAIHKERKQAKSQATTEKTYTVCV